MSLSSCRWMVYSWFNEGIGLSLNELWVVVVYEYFLIQELIPNCVKNNILLEMYPVI